MKNLILFICILFGTSTSWATPQFPDILIKNGKRYYIKVPGNDLPLKSHPDYKEISRIIYKYKKGLSTACWRSYYATYEITNKLLYLKKIHTCTDHTEVDLKEIFGKDLTPKGVKVTWYSGELECKHKKGYFYIHAFAFEAGKFKKKSFYDNSKTKYIFPEVGIQRMVYEHCNWEELPFIAEKEHIEIEILVETDDEQNVIDVTIKEPTEGLSIWEAEAVRIAKMIPQWHTIYKKGKRVPLEKKVYFRSQEYYDAIYKK